MNKAIVTAFVLLLAIIMISLLGMATQSEFQAIEDTILSFMHTGEE